MLFPKVPKSTNLSTATYSQPPATDRPPIRRHLDATKCSRKVINGSKTPMHDWWEIDRPTGLRGKEVNG